MVLTKRQKVMVTVLGLGLAGLAADRLMLEDGATGPGQAQAASPGVPVAATGNPAGSPTVELLDNSLASRLDTLRDVMALDLSATKDAFCPSELWLSDLRPEERVVTSSDEVRVMDFGRRHQLKAIASSGTGGAAFIDEKFVRVGQVIDGFRLVKIGYRMVVLESNGVEVVLRLQDAQQDR